MIFADLLGQLTLEEKVRILTGQDFWSTHPLPGIGLRSMVLSDGPSGVRGPVWDERDPSLNLPSATALSSSWDLDIAHRYGVVSALEARRKNVDVVLGPTINLHRSPLGGRHFEAFSEDPVLTAELAAAYVAGVQELGTSAATHRSPTPRSSSSAPPTRRPRTATSCSASPPSATAASLPTATSCSRRPPYRSARIWVPPCCRRHRSRLRSR